MKKMQQVFSALRCSLTQVLHPGREGVWCLAVGTHLVLLPAQSFGVSRYLPSPACKLGSGRTMPVGLGPQKCVWAQKCLNQLCWDEEAIPG